MDNEQIEKQEKDIVNQLMTMNWEEHLSIYEHIHKATCERLIALKDIGERATKILISLQKISNG